MQLNSSFSSKTFQERFGVTGRNLAECHNFTSRDSCMFFNIRDNHFSLLERLEPGLTNNRGLISDLRIQVRTECVLAFRGGTMGINQAGLDEPLYGRPCLRLTTL
jgi:hypothetical protein